MRVQSSPCFERCNQLQLGWWFQELFQLCWRYPSWRKVVSVSDDDFNKRPKNHFTLPKWQHIEEQCPNGWWKIQPRQIHHNQGTVKYRWQQQVHCSPSDNGKRQSIGMIIQKHWLSRVTMLTWKISTTLLTIYRFILSIDGCKKINLFPTRAVRVMKQVWKM